MNIIFGDEKVKELKDKYTVLELDTVRFTSSGTTVIVYAVVENIPIDELPNLSFQKSLHENLMINYRKRDWNFCKQAIENLIGAFGNEIDTFYVELQSRINEYQQNDPGDDWDFTISKLDTSS